jgi:choline-sulfatase
MLKERAISLWEPEKQQERYTKTPMASREKHFYKYSNQFLLGDGTVSDARP